MTDFEWVNPLTGPETDWGKAMAEWDRLLKALPPLPRRLECGPTAYVVITEALRLETSTGGGRWQLAEGYGMDWVFGIDILISEKLPSWSWRFLDTHGKVLKEGTFREVG